jgi:hypothetical protein
MNVKPNAKPLVLGWLNPPAKGRLTLKQNKIKQEGAGFGSSNQNQNPPNLLVGLTDKKGFFSCFFFCGRIENAKTRPPAERLSTSFPQGFQQPPSRRELKR